MSQPAEEIGFKSIEVLKEELGTGAFGSVHQARCDDLLCAAKTIHQGLVDESPSETPTKYGNHRIPIRKFEAEFVFLQELRHPNIIQYLGMYRDPQTKLPVILMELMDESLTDYLQNSTKSVPYHTQVNLCYDITQALSYLHVNEIVHRDLSSNNILLSGKPCRAKLSDFGMAKFLNTHISHTEVYMPLESFDHQAKFKESGDVFSFGVVVVQILTRQFPNPGPRAKEVPMPNDPRFPAGTARVLVSEIERRDNHISTIEPSNPLLPLALSCLQDSSVKRPSASDLCKSLAPLIGAPEYAESKSAEESPVHESLGTSDYAIITLAESSSVSTVDKSIGTSDYSESQPADDSLTNQGVDTTLSEFVHVCFDQNTNEKIAHLEQALSEKDQIVSDLHQAVSDKDQIIGDLQQAVSERDQIIADLKQAVLDKDQIIEEQEETLKATKLSLQTKESVFEHLVTENSQLQQLKQTQEGEVNELREKFETSVQESKKKEEIISQQRQRIDELVSDMSSQVYVSGDSKKKPRQKGDHQASPHVRQKCQEQGKQAASLLSDKHTQQQDLKVQSGRNLSSPPIPRDTNLKSEGKHQGLSKLIASDRQGKDFSNALKVKGSEDTNLKQNKSGQERDLHNHAIEHTKQLEPSSQSVVGKQETITRVEGATANPTSTLAETHPEGADTTKEHQASTLDRVEKEMDEIRSDLERKDNNKRKSIGGFFSFFSRKDKQSPIPKAAASISTADQLQHSSSVKPSKSKETTSMGEADMAKKPDINSSKAKDTRYPAEGTRQQTMNESELDEKQRGISKLIASDRQNKKPLNFLNVSGSEHTSLKQKKPGQEGYLHNNAVQPSEHLPKPVTPTQPRDHSKQPRKGTPSSAETQKQNQFSSKGATSTTGRSMKREQEAITRKEVATASSTSTLTETYQMGADTRKDKHQAVKLDRVEKLRDDLHCDLDRRTESDDVSKPKTESSRGLFSWFSKKDDKKPTKSPPPKAPATISTADQLQRSSGTKTSKETTGRGKADMVRRQAKTEDIRNPTEWTGQRTWNPFLDDEYGDFGRNVADSSNAKKQQTSQQDSQRRKQMAIERMEKSSGRALRTLNDTYRIGVATAEELDTQQETLDRVERQLDHMEDRLHTGAQSVKELESDSPFRWFSRKKKASKESPKPKPPEMPSTSKPGLSRVNPSTHATSQLHQYPSTGSTVVDRNLDEMSRQLEGLKGVGEHIGEQLDCTDAQLDRIKYKTERTGSAFETLKKDIARQL